MQALKLDVFGGTIIVSILSECELSTPIYDV